MILGCCTHIPPFEQCHILECVYMVMDVIVLSLLLFALLFAGSFLFCIRKPDKEENELHELMPFNRKEPEQTTLS